MCANTITRNFVVNRLPTLSQIRKLLGKRMRRGILGRRDRAKVGAA